ncbi:MAG: CPBP family intramembrane metalloprotease [Saprospiraceae bacterium]|nr:CPBP family intramembrane metalloprotease [Saprospiraceae bacterium]
MNPSEAYSFLNQAKSGLYGKAILLLALFCLIPLIIFIKILLNFIFAELNSLGFSDDAQLKNSIFYTFCIVSLLFSIKFFHKISPSQWIIGSNAFALKSIILTVLIYGTLLYSSSQIQAKWFGLEINEFPFEISSLNLLVGVSVFTWVLFEELFFRAYLLQQFYLIFKDLRITFILSGALFAAIHYTAEGLSIFDSFLVLIYYFLVSIILSIFTVLSDGITVPIAIHFTNNLAALALSPSKYFINESLNLESIKISLLTSFVELIICACVLYWILLQTKLISNIKKLNISYKI